MGDWMRKIEVNAAPRPLRGAGGRLLVIARVPRPHPLDLPRHHFLQPPQIAVVDAVFGELGDGLVEIAGAGPHMAAGAGQHLGGAVRTSAVRAYGSPWDAPRRPARGA